MKKKTKIYVSCFDLDFIYVSKLRKWIDIEDLYGTNYTSSNMKGFNTLDKAWKSVLQLDKLGAKHILLWREVTTKSGRYAIEYDVDLT